MVESLSDPEFVFERQLESGCVCSAHEASSLGPYNRKDVSNNAEEIYLSKNYMSGVS